MSKLSAYLEAIKDSVLEKEIIIGGSYGLWLQGIDLNRPLGDLDITVQKDTISAQYLKQVAESEGVEYRESPSCGNVDVQQKFDLPDKKYLKINYMFATTVDGLWREISYRGLKLKVIHKYYILQWKLKYAVDGNEKHLKDLVKIDPLYKLILDGPWNRERKEIWKGLPF